MIKLSTFLYSYRNRVDVGTVRIGAGEVEGVDEIKYLGVVLDYRLRFDTQIGLTSIKISRVIGMLSKLCHFYPIDVLRTLYFTFVHPHLLYGLEVWYGAPVCLSNKLSVLQKRAVRCVNGLDYGAHTGPAFRDMKLLPLCKLYEFCIGVYMFRTMRVVNYDRQLFNRLNALQDQHDHLTRNRLQIIIPRFNKATTQQCILYRGIVILNGISHKLDISVVCFKKFLKERLLAEI